MADPARGGGGVSDNSRIEWTDATWNPVAGCTKVSPGCDHCYAERVTERFHGPGSFATVKLLPDRLEQPLRWRKPRRVFVNSMSDLFHDDVPDGYIGAVFDVMARAEQHTFQILTKRHGRMRSLLNAWATDGIVSDSGYLLDGRPLGDIRVTSPLWTPPPNVWLGVSVEDPRWADIRIPALLDTPAAVRFLSCEPLLGPIDLPRLWLDSELAVAQTVDWVIVGGESGPNARPMHPAWARAIRDQCTTAGVPFLFKQWGEWAPSNAFQPTTVPRMIADSEGQVTPVEHDTEIRHMWLFGGSFVMARIGKKAAGRRLFGRTWDEYPEPLAVSA
jgi:protein gp37